MDLKTPQASSVSVLLFLEVPGAEGSVVKVMWVGLDQTEAKGTLSAGPVGLSDRRGLRLSGGVGGAARLRCGQESPFLFLLVIKWGRP